MILLDSRFEVATGLLPAWIAKHTSATHQFGVSVKATAQFFKYQANFGAESETFSDKYKDKEVKNSVIEWTDFPILYRSFKGLLTLLRILGSVVLFLFSCSRFVFKLGFRKL